MTKSAQFLAKATEYGGLAKTADTAAQAQELHRLEQSFRTLADNEQWLSDHRDQTIQAPRHTILASGGGQIDALVDTFAVAIEDDQILSHLGAAVILRWNTLPAKLQRELFDAAGAMGEASDTDNLRAQIARYLHRHKNDQVNA